MKCEKVKMKMQTSIFKSLAEKMKRSIIEGGYEEFCLDFITFNARHALRMFIDKDKGLLKEVKTVERIRVDGKVLEAK